MCSYCIATFFAQNRLLVHGEDSVVRQIKSRGKRERKPNKLSLLSFTENHCKAEAGLKSWGFQRALREAALGLTLNLIFSMLKEAALEKCPYAY